MNIVLIGAGSMIFSVNLIRDILLSPFLEGITVTLMDIDSERLKNCFILCSKLSKELGRDINIKKTDNRREALRGADFVICTALAAGHEILQKGWAIAKKNGYRFGGSLHIMHDEAFWINFFQFQMMEEIAKDILDICPEAWLLMVSNPVMAGTTLITRRYPSLKIAGLCHGFSGVYSLGKLLGLNKEDISFETPGVNHFIWLTKFEYKGKDAFPILDNWITEKSEQYFKRCGFSEETGPKAFDLYKRFKVFPIGDTCTPGGGSWGYWYHTDKKTEKYWKEDPSLWYKRYFIYYKQQMKRIKTIAEDPSCKVLNIFSKERSDEPMIPLIEGLGCNQRRKVIVNIPNKAHTIPQVPEDFAVEVPVIATSKGLEVLSTTPVPLIVQYYMLKDRVINVEIELEAYSKKSRELLLELILQDPWTNNKSQAEKLLKDIFDMECCSKLKNFYK